MIGPFRAGVQVFGVQVFRSSRKVEPVEPALGFWMVDRATWREFVDAVRTYEQQPRASRCALDLSAEPPAIGLEVVVQENQVQVGERRFSLIGFEGLRVTLQPAWLEFEDEYGNYFYPVPVPRHARADAARIATRFTETMAAAVREAEEERARPTLNNRLLTWVEQHFILVLLLFFFVLLPAIVVAISWLFPGLQIHSD